jgi:hypothetical protein
MHQPVKKSSALYEARRFITVFTRARCFFLSWTVSVRSMPFFRALFRVSVASMPRFLKWSRHFLHISPPNPCMHLSSHSCYMPHTSLSSWFCHPDNICWPAQIMQLITVQFSPVFYCLFPVGPSTFPSTVFANALSSLCYRPSFTPI